VKFIETRGNEAGFDKEVAFSYALLNPSASFGGLYVPKKVPHLDNDFIISNHDLSYKELAEKILKIFEIDIDDGVLKEALSLYDGFDNPSDTTPVVKIEEGLFVNELYHGPTRAFKDMALQPFGHILSDLARKGEKKYLILAATSGDTGPATLDTFANKENIQVVCLYPDGGTSDVQRLQMVTQEGKNLKVIGIHGNFDDAFTKSLTAAKESGGYTVNSINPFRIEGQKTIPYRALEFLEWETPDWIVYPGGALGNTSSCGKCLMELYEWGWIKKIPRIAVINADGANTLDVLYNGKFEDTELRWNDGNPDTELINRYYIKMNKDGIRPKTKATAIQIGKPSNLVKGLRALEFTDGIVISITDKEMLDGMSIVGLNGFDCEMASGAVPAGIKKLLNENIIKKDDEIVGILTGRQKEPLLPINYHNEPTNQFAKPPKQ